MRRALLSYSVALALIGALILRPASAQGETWIIRNARVVPVSGPALERGSVVVRDGLIAEVGAEVAVPPGAKELDGQGLNVYPGLIDLHTALAQPAQMPADRAPKNPAQPDLGTAEGQLKAVPSGITPAWRVETVLQAGSSDLEAARGAGVTTALSAPRQGCVPGQGAFIYTRGERAEDLPAGAVAPLYFQFTNPGGHYPATLMGILAAQRQALLDAQRARETPSGAADPTSAALLPLLGGERPAFFVAGREREIRRVLRLCDEFRMRP
ncbi:MAG TPA: hypothetical protein VK689_06830, partial [Armatimonadota bacterium]|nr:hypothetical protein [Armatimonadota bacterium]